MTRNCLNQGTTSASLTAPELERPLLLDRMQELGVQVVVGANALGALTIHERTLAGTCECKS
jgi:hypothetical protein